MATLLIGIDDTDNADSRGTGYQARALLEECRRRGLRPLGVTRHQFLVDPRIPYTSHNSGACVAVEANGGAEAAADFVFDFVARAAATGSDPAACIARAGEVPAEVVAFGRRAASEVLEASEAINLARRAGLLLRPLGGSGLGVIGALASVGLRAGGGDGRFIDLPGPAGGSPVWAGGAGLRDLPGRVGEAELVRLGIRLDHRGVRRCRPDDAYDTLGWVRPRLVGGGPVLPVEWCEERNAWVPIDRKRGRAAE